jgi:ribosomal protein L11 methyltransferase
MSGGEPRFPLVAVEVAAADADETAALLVELGAEGVEVRDEMTTPPGPAPGRALLRGSFADAAAAAAARQELRALGLSAELDEVVGDAWRDAYKEHFVPFSLAPGLVVAPPWLPRPDGAVLVLDPGRAFGTGLHATTQLAAAELERRRDAYRGRAVLDVGTGSGILALAAILWGAAEAVGVDNDPEAIEVAGENAERNALADRAHLVVGELAAVSRRFPAVVANIQTAVLVPLASELAAATEPGGLLVLSGVLEPEEEEILAAYRAAFEHLGTTMRDGWIAVALRRARA